MNDAPPPYDAVVFDCDSTLSRIEGIEELAGRHRAQIRALTDRAMNGELPLEDVFGARLALIRPGIGELEVVGRRYVEEMTTNAAAVVSALRALGKRVCIVSGGLLPAVLALAHELGIPERDVFAVGVHFDECAEYAGFDVDSPLARAGGKLTVVSRIADESGAVALVGDGATDLEASPACARFVAYGGVLRRESVFAAALHGSSSEDLAALLPLLLSAEERARLADHPEHGALVNR